MEHKKKIVITTGLLLLMGMSVSSSTGQIMEKETVGFNQSTALMIIRPLEELIQLPVINTRAAPSTTEYMEEVAPSAVELSEEPIEQEKKSLEDKYRAEFEHDLMMEVYKREYSNGSLSMKAIKVTINLLDWTDDKKEFALKEIEAYKALSISS